VSILIDDQDILGLSQAWHFRLDNGSGLVYKFTLDECKYIRLNSRETIALVLCDGYRRLGEVVELLSKMLHLDKAKALQVIQALLRKDDKQDSFIAHLAEHQEGFVCCDIPHTLQVLASHKLGRPKIQRLQYPLSLLLIVSLQDIVDKLPIRPSRHRRQYLTN
jgi:hypothetical protein